MTVVRGIAAQPFLAPVPLPVTTVRAVPDAPGRSAGARWYDEPRLGAGIVVVLAVVSAWTFTAGIQTPWPWSDEGATYLALQRDWAQLLVLSRSPDAPLVPYYYLAKAWTAAVQASWPAMPTMTAVRLLSAAAATLTVLALYALVTRRAGRLAGLFSGLLLVSLPGFSRFAQEARPYALLALAATVSWLMWDRWLQPRMVPGLDHTSPADAEGPPRTRAKGVLGAAGYALGLAGVATIHTFGLFQWPAQVLATLFARGGLRVRLRRYGALVVVVIAAGGIAASQVIASVTFGTGPPGIKAIRVVNEVTTLDLLTRSLTAGPDISAAQVVLGLAVIGLLGLFTRERRGFTFSMLVWLVVPLGAELVLAASRTNLFRLRYWVASLPPLAALAGLGLAGLTTVAVRLVHRVSGGSPRGLGAAASRAAATIAAVVGAGAAVALLWLQVTMALPSQVQVRAPNGHGEDIGEIVALVDATRARHPGLTVVMTSRWADGLLSSVEPSILPGNPVMQLDPGTPSVYPVFAPPNIVMRRLAGDSNILWIYKGHVNPRHPLTHWTVDPGSTHLRVLWVKPTTTAWTAVLMTATASATG